MSDTDKKTPETEETPRADLITGQPVPKPVTTPPEPETPEAEKEKAERERREKDEPKRPTSA